MLNHIILAKPSGRWGKINKESLRCYFPSTERIIFAEHYQLSYMGKTTNYNKQCRQLKDNVFKPLVEYFKKAKKTLGITAKEIERATGKQMASHWFGYSQWQLPSKEDYHKLQILFEHVASKNRHSNPFNREYSALVNDRNLLNIKYDELAAKYQLLRRHFSVTVDVKHTDVWDYPPVQYYPNKHPCEKPVAMMEHIIKSSSQQGDLVADFFMGSGSAIKAALKLNRRSLGVELEQKWFEQTKQEITRLQNETSSHSN